MGAKAKGVKKAIHSVDTLAFTESLGLQTFRKGQRKTWVKHDDEVLLQRLNEMYPVQIGENSLKARDVDWEQVAEVFCGERKAKDCRKRWALSLDPNLRRGKWTPQEDELLMQQFQLHGALWQQVALQIEGRTEHQCLKRYYEVLDPNVRNRLQPWTEAEDVLLIELVTCHGTKWKTIASEFAGRPSLTCRNRWRNLVTAVVRGRASPAVMEKMAGKFDGNLELLAEGLFPAAATAAGLVGLVPLLTLAVPEQVEALADAVTSTNPSPPGPEPAIHVASPLPQKAPWQDTFAGPQTVPAPPSSEWKYTLAGSSGVPENDPLRALLAFGGNIHSEHLANCLSQCAAQYNLQVNIHHHHHYPGTTARVNVPVQAPAPTSQQEQQQQQQQNDLPGFATLHQEISTQLPFFGSTPGPEFAPSPASHGMSSTTSRFYSIEPEAQLSRFQHFNYLPPLTPVPKLQSSASLPAASSKGSTHHHHHHHHHHMPYAALLREEGGGGVGETVAERDPNLGKESDLFRLLNEGVLKREQDMEIDAVAGAGNTTVGTQTVTSRLMGKPLHFEDESRSNSMTPLTQAVQMAAATDAASTAFYKRSADEFAISSAKRLHLHTGPEHEQGLDFFDPALPAPAPAAPAEPLAQHNVKTEAKNRDLHAAFPSQKPPPQQLPAQDVQQQQQPVSQHHPLHYFTSNTTAPLEDMVDEEDEDFLSSWGMYSMRDKPQEPLEISDESNAWFPFNPS